MNVVILTGNLARDPEKTYTGSGMAVVRFTVAVNRFTRKEGGQDADFIRVTAFDKQADLVERYLHKGSKVGVEGRIQTGSYEKDGKTVYTTDVIANRVEFLDRKEQGSGGGGYEGQNAPRQDAGNYAPTQAATAAPIAEAAPEAPVAPPLGFEEIDDDDMPF